MTVTLPPPRCSHLSARADPGTTPRQSAEACRSSTWDRRPPRRGAGRNSFKRVWFHPPAISYGPEKRAEASKQASKQRPKQRTYSGNRTGPVRGPPERPSLREVVTANTIGASDSSSHPDPLSTSPPPSQAILQNERSKRARTRVSASTLPSIRFTRAQGTPPFANTPQTV